jgi:hypothetical protein
LALLGLAFDADLFWDLLAEDVFKEAFLWRPVLKFLILDSLELEPSIRMTSKPRLTLYEPVTVSFGELEERHRPVVDVFISMLDEEPEKDLDEADETDEEREPFEDELGGSRTVPQLPNDGSMDWLARLNFILNLRLNFMQENVILVWLIFFVVVNLRELY